MSFGPARVLARVQEIENRMQEIRDRFTPAVPQSFASVLDQRVRAGESTQAPGAPPPSDGPPPPQLPPGLTGWHPTARPGYAGPGPDHGLFDQGLPQASAAPPVPAPPDALAGAQGPPDVPQAFRRVLGTAGSDAWRAASAYGRGVPPAAGGPEAASPAGRAQPDLERLLRLAGDGALQRMTGDEIPTAEEGLLDLGLVRPERTGGM